MALVSGFLRLITVVLVVLKGGVLGLSVTKHLSISK